MHPINIGPHPGPAEGHPEQDLDPGRGSDEGCHINDQLGLKLYERIWNESGLKIQENPNQFCGHMFVPVASFFRCYFGSVAIFIFIGKNRTKL